ncbi:hypothetical protein Tco_0472439 [Tanacetum coccineum]
MTRDTETEATEKDQKLIVVTTHQESNLKDLKQTCSAMMTFKGTSMLQNDIPEDQNVEDNSSINPLFPEAQNVVTDTEAEDNGNINILVPEAQNGVADTAAVDNGNIKPSLPEAQNDVPDTTGEDNGDINYLVFETQNGVADTAGEDNGGINCLVSETQNGVADTAGEDIGNISPLVEQWGDKSQFYFIFLGGATCEWNLGKVTLQSLNPHVDAAKSSPSIVTDRETFQNM